ncbi:amidohydrolase family protein [Streptomyces sp. NPDC050485]|uniref:amidohydrolase family protein n=1 Tax=Streptomyces sp. NPDC050485 TaxID=3365617 RepID=UPI0037A41C99
MECGGVTGCLGHAGHPAARPSRTTGRPSEHLTYRHIQPWIGHFSPYGVDGPLVASPESAHARARRLSSGGTVAHDAQFAGARHPTRDDLDAVDADRPVLVIHQSSHLGSVNSKALELLGYDADSEDPAGGVNGSP